MKRLAFFELIVAFRFMREGLTQTLLIILGVGLGGGVIIFMSAALAGLEGNVVRRTLNFLAPIVILPPDQVARPLRGGSQEEIAAQVQPRSQQLRSIDQWQKIRDQVERTAGVDDGDRGPRSDEARLGIVGAAGGDRLPAGALGESGQLVAMAKGEDEQRRRHPLA